MLERRTTRRGLVGPNWPVLLHLLFSIPAGAQQLTLPPAAPQADRPAWRLHLLDETLRVPFAEDWGGETRLFSRFGRLDVGVFARAWAETVCDRPDCAGRAIHAGAQTNLNVTPALDVGFDFGVHRGASERTGSLVLSRVRLKF